MPTDTDTHRIIMELQQKMQKMEAEKVQTENEARRAIAQAAEAQAALDRRAAQMSEQYQEATQSLQSQ